MNIDKLLIASVFILMLVVFPSYSSAQVNSVTNSTYQIWIDYNQKWKISDKLFLNGQTGVKTISTDKWNRYFISSDIVYILPKLIFKSVNYREEIKGGVDVYYNQNFDGVDVIEVAPYQGYSVVWPNKERLAIKHYLQLRERFQSGTNDWKNTFGLKLSYELSLNYNLKGELWKYSKGFYIPVSLKFNWNIKDVIVFNNVFRFTPGIGYQFNQQWKASFLVGYNRTRNGENEEFKTNDMIFRFRVYKLLGK